VEGIFYPLVVPEAYVQKGETIGYITNYFGEQVAELVAPSSGLVLYIGSVPSVKKGDSIGYIGELASSAETASVAR
jgi:predicted deacylase